MYKNINERSEIIETHFHKKNVQIRTDCKLMDEHLYDYMELASKKMPGAILIINIFIMNIRRN